MRLVAIEREAGRQGPPQPPEPLECLLPVPVVTHFELAVADDANLNLVAFLERERFDDR
jgi:hypothetical protein